MKPSIEKLHKFIKLETHRGYDDQAVMGGLGEILNSWDHEARADNLPEDLIKAIGMRLRSYRNLEAKSRAETLKGLWGRIQRSIDEPLPDFPSDGQQKCAPVRSRRASPEKTAVSPKTVRQVSTQDAKPASAVTKFTPRVVSAPTSPKGEIAALNAPLTVLSGVGTRYAQSLARLGMNTLGDALYYFPRRYDDYSELKPINRLRYGEEVTVIGTVQQVGMRPLRGGKTKLIEAVVSDGSGALRVSWFNQPWLVSKLRDAQIVLSGKIDQYLGRLVMTNPEWELLDRKNLHTNRIVPIYSLTASITQRWLRRTLHQVVSYWAPRVQETLPEKIRQEAGQMPLPTALVQVHFPDSRRHLEDARHRLAFDEIFLLQLGCAPPASFVDESYCEGFQHPPRLAQRPINAITLHLDRGTKTGGR